ncbi:MAG TPA: ABC transporter ATP-binding protein [Terriglobia bacterium]|nr:ABC transporter ATP-binding protein [Terriglobia bacterium]
MPEARATDSSASHGAPVIQLRGVHKIYRTGEIEVHALRGVTLEVHRGEFVAVMGPSGSGKSTMMNIIGCLDRLSSGTYVLDGVDVSTMSKNELADTRNQKIGFVFQAFNLIPRTSALANVELPMVYAGVSPGERRERARQALEGVGLGEKEASFPNQLSGGQQQRVALARAIASNPAIILADEPTGALDSKTAEEIMRMFQELNRERGITIVLVTHEADVALHAKRLVRFKDGHIQEDRAILPQDDILTLLHPLEETSYEIP